MPQIGFVCPDGGQAEFQQCFDKCRMGERCLSIRTLKAIAERRDWDGTPSTTQLLKGTREMWLQINVPYYIDPQSRIPTIIGTGAHSLLEQYGDGTSEERITDDTSSGAYDYYEDGCLYDLKTYGSYQAAKVMGFEKEQVPDGYYKTGDKKGQVKYKNIINYNGRKNRLDLAIQLNDYRMKIESTGRKVDELWCEILVRDCGTYLAKQRGVMRNGYLVRINKVSDKWILRFMQAKAKRLISHLERNEIPPQCTKRETWGGMKCASYCDVRNFCEYGGACSGQEE